VAKLDWPGIDHPVLVTTSNDEAARAWDPPIPTKNWPALTAIRAA
jgi:hypothetical protein